jgi:hypothetical protein
LACTGNVIEYHQPSPEPDIDSAGGAQPPEASSTVDFAREIRPILIEHCVRCHGGVRELGKLNLQTRAGAAHVLGSGDANRSALFQRVISTDPALRMPLGAAPLSSGEIEKLRVWLSEGAPWPTHWAFNPITSPDAGAIVVSDEAWIRTPIDRFILAKLDRASVHPSARADPVTLARRLFLDLVGLPPTPEDVARFVEDSAPGADGRLVDRLLASPAFGERWARHWLDRARYSDSDGYYMDAPRPNAWRYRDWVVDAINRDLPFDAFTLQQIAGDLLPDATPLTALATAFHRQTLANFEAGIDVEEDRVKRTVDRTATVANVWLGLTLQCAQCHGHPYERISQREFYGLYAFFDDADEKPVSVPKGPHDAETVSVDTLVQAATPRRTYLLSRGDFMQPDKQAGELAPATPSALPPLPKDANRLDLARWLVDAKNPLTARVAVNTIWYHLFGRGIVETLSDFGAHGALPSHPELLDHLATELVRNGWSRKRAIKTIVLSATYQQASAARPSAADPDNRLFHRQNRLRVEAEIVHDLHLALSGLLDRRLGGPSVFPALDPELQKLTQHEFSDFVWVDSTGRDRYRRGLYTFHKRSLAHPNLKVFGWPTADVSQNGRAHSTTPLQALTTLHNRVFVEAAQAFARRARREMPAGDHERLVWMFRQALARPPSEAELAELAALHAANAGYYASHPEDAALAVGAAAETEPAGAPLAPGDLANAAAWVATARVILNLEEFITRE